MQRRALLIFTAAATLATPLWAQETRRVRATIEKVDGSTLYVKTRDGEDLKITLSEKPAFMAIIPATLADLKPGTFVGSGATPGPDGSLVAMEVHIFPESMRGTGEGHRPMEGQATMTNANVDVSVAAVDGQMLTLKYKDGEKKILVTPKTAIVAYTPGDRAELKPGIKIFISAAQKQSDGSLQATRISYGRDGLTPPM
jgi:Domain of unknown function (DUF5666)